ncbi:signal transduction histidine kinase [Arthrobacter sp. PvP023]|uniref:sensor histidine kinase n=1 Tax=Micrococcaceae TaxID=1268 RepID=UPI001AE74646|nr:ATP-binding protein [Arthrobacter sp. PvP023]MBP1134778.1 signal transduction histidine kinase [Arthrobacter sp. PvP023]
MEKAPAVNEVAAIHGVITDQAPVDFHALGLAGCIDRLATPLREQGTTVRWETPHHGIEIPAGSAGLLYHAAQEALSNAFKFAAATQLTVRLAAVHHGIRLTVADNGTGFDRAESCGSRPQGFGLLLMSIAVHEAGGTATIDTAPGKGTCITVTLPLD